MSMNYGGGPAFQYNPYSGFNPYQNNPIANPQQGAYDPRYFQQQPGQINYGPAPGSGGGPQPAQDGTPSAGGAQIQPPEVQYNVDVQGTPSPQGGAQGTSQAQGGAAPVQVQPLPYVDPFAQSELGQLLRMISSGFARSPYGQHLGQGQQIGGLPFPQGGGSGAQPIYQGSPVNYQPQEYLAPIGPMEHSMRSTLLRQLLGGTPYDGLRGQSRSQHYTPQGYQAATHTTNTPAMYPELWDPYKGLFQWNGRSWNPQQGGY